MLPIPTLTKFLKKIAGGGKNFSGKNMWPCEAIGQRHLFNVWILGFSDGTDQFVWEKKTYHRFIVAQKSLWYIGRQNINVNNTTANSETWQITIKWNHSLVSYSHAGSLFKKWLTAPYFYGSPLSARKKNRWNICKTNKWQTKVLCSESTILSYWRKLFSIRHRGWVAINFNHALLL